MVNTLLDACKSTQEKLSVTTGMQQYINNSTRRDVERVSFEKHAPKREALGRLDGEISPFKRKITDVTTATAILSLISESQNKLCLL